MVDPSALSEILWSSDPVTRSALFRILVLVVPIAAIVMAPLIARATRLWLLERRLRDTLDEYDSKGEAAQRGALREWLRNSLIRRQYDEFERRWNTAQLVEGGQRAPIRLLDVLEDQPLLPFGPRRSLLPVLPGLFLGIGVFGALLGLIPSVTSGLAAPAAGMADPLAMALGLALRATAWGFAAAIAASMVGRLIEGSFEARGRGLDEVLVRAHPSVSPGELAEITRQTQQRSLETLGRELTQFAHELNERLERGLQRIEQSSARAASLVSQEQRGALHSVVQELSLAVRQGVEHHLGELRLALQRTADYQSSVTTGLSETYERMLATAQMQERVARTLMDSANALDAAASSLDGAAASSDGAASSLDGGASASRPGNATRPSAGGEDGSSAARSTSPASETRALAAELAQEIGGALRSFTEQVRQIDRTLDTLRQEMRPPDRSPAKTEPAPVQRERTWSPSAAQPIQPPAKPPSTSMPIAPGPPAGTSPSTPPPQQRATALAGLAANEGRAGLAQRGDAANSSTHALSSAPSSPPSSAPPAAPAADVAAIEGPIGRELSLSGFRVGAPRAQGPDPYERLARAAETPSNVRHFPTRDRELGDELKLSGLLGPSAPLAPSAASIPPASSAPSPNPSSAASPAASPASAAPQPADERRRTPGGDEQD